MVWPSHPCELYVVTGLPRTVSLIYWSLKLHTRSCWCQCWTDRGEMAQWQCLHCSRLQSPPGLAGGFITSACLHWIEAGQELHSVVIFFFFVLLRHPYFVTSCWALHSFCTRGTSPVSGSNVLHDPSVQIRVEQQWHRWHPKWYFTAESVIQQTNSYILMLSVLLPRQTCFAI